MTIPVRLNSSTMTFPELSTVVLRLPWLPLLDEVPPAQVLLGLSLGVRPCWGLVTPEPDPLVDLLIVYTSKWTLHSDNGRDILLIKVVCKNCHFYAFVCHLIAKCHIQTWICTIWMPLTLWLRQSLTQFSCFARKPQKPSKTASNLWSQRRCHQQKVYVHKCQSMIQQCCCFLIVIRVLCEAKFWPTSSIQCVQTNIIIWGKNRPWNIDNYF